MTDTPKTPATNTPDAKPEGTDRIAKVMARAGVASRREAERMIREGRVRVNGKPISSPALDVTPADRILVDDKPLDEPQETRLWLYYKPLGLVTTESDEKGRQTVFDALPRDLPRVMSVGRLDLNSEGLLLLTNDGDLKRRLELPATGWLRRYRVRVNGQPNELTFEPLRRGTVIEGEEFAPMEIKLDSQQGANAWLTVGIREGKNREIRRAMAHVGLMVNRLIRIGYGPFKLTGLEPNEVREVRRRTLRDQLGGLLTGDVEDKPREHRAYGAAGGRDDAPRVARGEGEERKPWGHREDGPRKPFARRDDGDRKPWGRRDDGAGKPSTDRPDRKPFERREGAGRKPWAKREEGSDRKPWAKRDDGGERKPWAKREEGGDRKPWAKRDEGGERKPWAKREEGGDRKPWAKRDEGGDRKPFAGRGGEDRKPWARRDEGPARPSPRDENAPRKPRSKSGDRKDADRKPMPQRDGGDRKPWARREGEERKGFGAREGGFGPRKDGAKRFGGAKPGVGRPGDDKPQGARGNAGGAKFGGKPGGFRAGPGKPGPRPGGAGKGRPAGPGGPRRSKD